MGSMCSSTIRLSLMNFPGAPFCNKPARKPPKTGLRAEREKFYNQTPPPAAPTRKPLETGPQAEQAKLYDQAPYRSLTAKYPGASVLGLSSLLPHLLSSPRTHPLGLPLGLPLNVLNLPAPLKLISVGIPLKLDPLRLSHRPKLLLCRARVLRVSGGKPWRNPQ
jgi:hypothetical protein